MYQSFNFHTHTYRCGHAVKDENDYIKSAIKNGFKSIGISEHCGYNGFDNSMERLPFSKMDDYLRDMKIAKEKYKDEIDVYIGLEFEYFDDLKNYYEQLKEKYDYMIIGQHCKDRSGMAYDMSCTDKDVRIYAQQICEALELGLTRYVAHPDYFMLGRNDYSKECEVAIKEIVNSAKRNNAVLELNLKGMRYGKRRYDNYESYIYPHSKTIQILQDEGAEVVIGYDAHNPTVLGEKSYEDNIKKIVGKKVKYIQECDKLLYANF